MTAHANEIALLATLFDVKLQAQLVDTGCEKKSVVLKEDGVQAKLKKLTIEHLDSHALVLIPERGRSKTNRITDMFASPSGWSHHQICDAVLFFHYRGKNYVVYAELKSDKSKGCAQQFQSTERLIDYAFATLESQKNHQRVDRRHIRVVFNTSRTTCQTLNKGPVNPRLSKAHYTVYLCVEKDAIISPANFCT